MMRTKNIAAIARKEIYHLLRDFRSLYLAFAIPLLLILLFGYALSLDVNNIETVVVDREKTDLSRDFIRSLEASSYFQIVENPDSMDAVIAALDRGRARLAIVIPTGWTDDLRSDREAKIQVILDGSDPNFAGITNSYISGFIARYNANLLADFLDRHAMRQINPPVNPEVRVWFNEEMESRNFIIPGIIAIIVIIVAALLTSLVIAREYENGTMETLRSLPIGAGEFLVGKAAPYFLIALIDVLIAILMGQVLFGIVMKASFWLMIVSSSLYIAVALTLGLLISTLTKSQMTANQTAILITYLPSILLSNFVFPVTNMPVALQAVTKIVPATYFINILSGIYLKNLGFSHIWPDLLVLFAMATLLALLNYLFLRKEGF
jgi:ABC-2 type transport system permease protein